MGQYFGDDHRVFDKDRMATKTQLSRHTAESTIASCKDLIVRPYQLTLLLKSS